MTFTGRDILTWLQECRIGCSIFDRLILFLYTLNAIVVLTALYFTLGTKRTNRLLLSKPGLLDWIPIPRVDVNVDGILLSLPLRIDYLLSVKPDWEVEGKEFLRANSERDGAILDIGSNIGYYSALLARENPSSRVISVEASPSIFENLVSNCKANGLSNISFYNRAVSDTDDIEIEFYNRDALSSIDRQMLDDWSVPENNITKERTKTITVDTLLERESVHNISLLKMDIEGAEVAALSGAKSVLEEKRIERMLIEYHTHSGRDYILNRLQKLGYQTSVRNRPSLYRNNDHANGHILAVL